MARWSQLMRSTLFAIFSVAFALFWVLSADSQLVSHGTPEAGARHAWQDLNEFMIGWGVSNETREALYDDYFYGFHHDKRTFAKWHVLHGIFWSIASLVNVWTGPPKGTLFRRLHKFSGYFYIASAFATGVYMPKYIIAGKLSFYTTIGEGTALISCVFFAVKGWIELRRKQWIKHGQSMQMSAAALWIIFVERPLFLLVNQVAFGLGIDLDNNNRSGEEGDTLSYREKTFGAASLLAMCICHVVGAWRAYYDMPNERGAAASGAKND